MATVSDKDSEQDELIRRNAESIRRNEAVIVRQTEALEKIRDHYFPKKTLWKRISGSFLKLVGAVTLVAGVMEAFEWYLNSRLMSSMASESAAVAQRLLVRENDLTGAVKFLEKASEISGGSGEYRIRLAYVKGLATIADLIDLGRPFTAEERSRIDDILQDAAFLQEMEPDAAMPYVLAAQAYGIRGERKAALTAVARAIELEPESFQARITACAQHFLAGELPRARQQLAEAERISPNFPLVLYWKSFFALDVDCDLKAARQCIEAMLEHAPRFPRAHIMMGRLQMTGEKPDLKAARAEFEQALHGAPQLVPAMTFMAETYERENKLGVARLWLDKALKTDATNMKALFARARLSGKTGDFAAAEADLNAAIELAPFRADLYLERSKMRAVVGDAAGAAKDRRTAADIQSAAIAANGSADSSAVTVK